MYSSNGVQEGATLTLRVGVLQTQRWNGRAIQQYAPLHRKATNIGTFVL